MFSGKMLRRVLFLALASVLNIEKTGLAAEQDGNAITGQSSVINIGIAKSTEPRRAAVNQSANFSKEMLLHKMSALESSTSSKPDYICGVCSCSSCSGSCSSCDCSSGSCTCE